MSRGIGAFCLMGMSGSLVCAWPAAADIGAYSGQATVRAHLYEYGDLYGHGEIDLNDQITVTTDPGSMTGDAWVFNAGDDGVYSAIASAEFSVSSSGPDSLRIALDLWGYADAETYWADLGFIGHADAWLDGASIEIEFDSLMNVDLPGVGVRQYPPGIHHFTVDPMLLAYADGVNGPYSDNSSARLEWGFEAVPAPAALPVVLAALLAPVVRRARVKDASIATG